jgi:hypothetical protein
MQLKITVSMLRASWDYHAASGPMVKWNLPPGEDVDLRLGRAKSSTYALTWHDKDRLWITFNTHLHGTSDTLHRSMAHEMIHWYMSHNHIKDTSDHGPVFQSYALAICKFHGYDPRAFTC